MAARTPERTVRAYNPATALKREFPEWKVMKAPIQCGEAWIASEHLILLPKMTRTALAHVHAHLSLGHLGGGGRISDAQEDDADSLAEIRLDDPSTRARELLGVL